MDKRIVRMIQDKLKFKANDSVYVHSMIRELSNCRDSADFITVIAQGIIAIDSARKESFNILTKRTKLGL